MTRHSSLLLKEVKHKRTKDYVSEQSGAMSDISSIRSPIITEKPENVHRARYQEDFPNHDIRDTADKHTSQDYEMPITSKKEIHSIRDYEAPTESEISTGDVKIKEKTGTHNLTDHNQNTLHCVGTRLTQFLVKKDLLFSRLSAFNDRPENYLMWKGSFSIIMKDLSVTPMEELDLLIKFLGLDSRQHANRIRTSYPSDPAKGLDRLLERLDERYGSLELVESILKEKISKFPRLTA